MHGNARFLTQVLSIAAISCGGDSVGNSLRDGSPGDASAVICGGDRWGGSDEMLATIAGCTTIAGNLSVTGNQLINVELPLLARIDGFLTIWGNPNLARVTLPSLVSIGGYLDVSSNDSLTNLAMPALASVNKRMLAVPSDVVVRDNPHLACQAETLREQLLARGFDGTLDIDKNGPCP